VLHDRAGHEAELGSKRRLIHRAAGQSCRAAPRRCSIAGSGGDVAGDVDQHAPGRVQAAEEQRGDDAQAVPTESGSPSISARTIAQDVSRPGGAASTRHRSIAMRGTPENVSGVL